MSSNQLPEKECTPKCYSQRHAALLFSGVTKGSAAEVRAYCNWLCHNFAIVKDEFHRNLLHVAASYGKWEIVEWLIDYCHCDVDIQDGESGWTALHRSLFYGHISVARILSNHHSDLQMIDNEGLTPLDLIIKDRPSYFECSLNYPQDVYVWGLNTNFNLGFSNQQSKEFPEILDAFPKEHHYVKQIVMCKFHTVFLYTNGKLYTCGHGHGGRLGQGSEVTKLTPSLVKGLGNLKCRAVAAGQDHLVLLMDDGQIWTCGLNTYHQLGHNPPPDRLVTPRSISMKFLLKKEDIVGVCAARFHSVVYTKNTLYTFGLNAGQLGLAKGSRTQIVPHEVSGIYDSDCKIVQVAASDGATVYATAQGSVYVFHEFRHRKIASKQLNILKVMVVGGHLDPKCDVTGIFKGGGLELRILLLNTAGMLLLWSGSDPHLRRCLFTSHRQLIIHDAHLNQSSIAVVTLDNQAYLGTISPAKCTKTPLPVSPSSNSTKIHESGLRNYAFLEVRECNFIRAKRVPYIHRATSITCDCSGKNFAVLQTRPEVWLLDFPEISESIINMDLKKFWKESSLSDNIHDIILKVGTKQYPAHKYILASRSMYFRKQISCLETSEETPTLVVNNVQHEAFEHILNYLYSDYCEFQPNYQKTKWIKELQNIEGHGKGKKGSSGQKRKSKETDFRSDPVKCMLEASKHFNLNALTKKLECAKLVDGVIKVPNEYPISNMKFDRGKLSDYYDVCLHSKDGVDFPCHKCILVARSDYFYSMIGSSCWLEKTQLESLPVSIPSDILTILLNYFYTDSDSVKKIENTELLCNILVVADQLLIPRLKEMCEIALVNLLSLKNAPEILQLASVYNAHQLKKTAMEFIGINLVSMLEYKNLDIIDWDVMEDLGRSYRQLIPRMQYRTLTPSFNHPDREVLKLIERSFPVDQHAERTKQILELSGSKSKTKRRLRLKDESKKIIEAKTKTNTSEIVAEKEISKIETPPPAIETLNEVDTIQCLANSLSSSIPRQRTLSAPKFNAMPSLKEIMMEEMSNQKEANMKYEKKRMPRLSQRERKILSKTSKNKVFISPTQESNVPTSPPSAWGKTEEVSSAPLSFWTSPKPSPTEKAKSVVSNFPLLESPSHPNRTKGMSFKDIQRDEKAAFNQMVKPKIKSLNIINLEDRAIEELLVLYKAFNNPEEKVTVSRVSMGNVAIPVWTTRKYTLST